MPRCDRRMIQPCAKRAWRFVSAPISYDRRDLDGQRALLTEHFAGAGWQTRRATRSCSRGRRLLLRRIRAGAHAGAVEGRVTLAGDAGYCASPLSGMGTSLALVGAYVLAGELGPGGVG